MPGERIEQPPIIQGAVWVMTPGRPGMPGPIFCLVPTAPIPQAPIESPARYGWIRVLCDADTTPERVGRIQHALADRGYYRGEVSGRYDRATVEAVTRFQSTAHIDHGGYLSLDTVQALEAPPAYPPAYAPAPVVAYGYQSGYQSGYQAGPAYTYGPPAAYPAPPPPVYYPQQAYAGPCCQTAQTYGYGAGYGGGYGFGAPPPAYAGASAQAYAGGAYASAQASTQVVQNGWLMWNGKSGR